MRKLISGALIVVIAIVTVALIPGRDTPSASACAFDPRRPHAYEGTQLRSEYLRAYDAVAANQLFPNHPLYRLDPVKRGTRGAFVDGPAFIPSTLLKAIGWVESNMMMASRATPWTSIGTGLVSFDCGHGAMQVTTGMTVPLGADGGPSERQVLTATHYAYNIAQGAQILIEKWNAAPGQRPIAGTDTGADPALIENWYFAVWAYNGFTGPGASQSNHPMDPQFQDWPRPPYQCGDNQQRNRYPYQELVWGCMANPPTVAGQRLWEPVPATLPNLTDPAFHQPLAVEHWRFPYSDMDIPTPKPSHRAPAPSLPGNIAAEILGTPQLSANSQRISVNVNEASGSPGTTVRIQNMGSGLLAWQAVTSDNFIVVDPPAGVAAGSGVTCAAGSCPHGELTISVNPTLLPATTASGTVTISSPNASGGSVTIHVDVVADFEIGAPGTSRP